MRRTAALLTALTLALPLAPLGAQAVEPAPLDARVATAKPQPGKPAKPSKAKKPLKFSVLSNRADLVSGGDVLVAMKLPKRLDRSTLKIRLNGKDVTKRFRVRPNGEFQALLKGLREGDNVLRGKARGYAGRAVITNHPNGGPIFSGPQHGPYQCQETAVDDQCNEPPTYSYLYKSTDPMQKGLLEYDPQSPPDDVATTTTDEGVEVPFVVRREDGFQARDRYSILTLFTPGATWKPWKPQEQWNRKLLVTHGGNCGASYAPGTPKFADYSGTFGDFPMIEDSYIAALGSGFAVASTALNNTGHNCNVVVEAESMMMVKERLVEQYGPLRYTIGTGCSGGSIAQHTIANAYPGIYQGLITSCSYPDTLSAGAQFADYHLMRKYFEDPSRWKQGVVWLPTQMADVEGHLTHINAVVADEGLFKAALNPENDCSGTKEPVAGDPTTRFDSDINPGGVRCSVLDIMANPLGIRAEADWSEWEKAAGRGFAGIPFSNTGVQYGLNALKSGRITAEQFLDLNEQIGGLDINSDPIPERIAGDEQAIANAYRTGLLNQANNLSDVAMINHGGPDPGVAHDYSHAWWTEHRLLREQGHTDNRVMWFGTVPLIGDVRWATEALYAMDRWLAAVEADTRRVPLAQKIVEDRPADVTDRCENVPGLNMKLLPGGDAVCEQPLLQTNLSTPRQEAGGPVTNDVLACTLKPLDRADYSFLLIPFTDAQWARMEAVFPDGVCDYDKPGQGQGPTLTWLKYADERSQVVYGGRELPASPARSATGWSAPAFAELLRR